MHIGLIDVDSHNFPNLALMKISAYEKSKGNYVEWWNGFDYYDKVYKSKVFTDLYSKDTYMDIWYREISVFDRTKYEFEQGGKEVTMKICIPRFKGVDSRCVCLIDGRQHLVYNAAHVKDKYGFPETELTLIRPEREIEIDEKS